jgi:hypothetical protein
MTHHIKFHKRNDKGSVIANTYGNRFVIDHLHK